MLTRASLANAAAPTAAVFALAACAHFEPQPLVAEQVAASYDQRSLDDDGLRSFLRAQSPDLGSPWPRPSWDLPTLTLVAFYFHPDLEVAHAQWRTADASVRTAAMRPNPTLTLTPGYNFSAVENSSPWIPAVSVDVLVETARKRSIRTAKAAHLAESARLHVLSEAWRVRTALRDALIEFTIARRRMTMLRDRQTIQQRVVDLLAQRLALGAASSAELSPARVSLTHTQVQVAEGERLLVEATSKLSRALGLPMRAVEDMHLDFSIATLPPFDVAQARSVALQTRADIAAGLAEYAASEADLQAEIAKQYPDLHVGPEFEWDQGEHKWRIGIGFELPVNGNQGAISEARARREESAARFRALEAGVIAQIDQASSNYAAALAQMSRIRQLHHGLEQEIVRQQARLAAGDIDQLEYQSAKLEAALSAIALLESEAQAAHAVGALEDELQRPIAALEALPAQSQRREPR